MVYKDIISGDEMVSDLNPVKVVDDVLFEIMCNMIVVRCEEPGEDPKDPPKVTAKTVIDVVEANQLVETSFDKKTYIKYIKGYMKRVREHLETTDLERADAFATGSMLVVKKILANFNEFQFFLGRSQDITAGLALVFYKEDGIVPHMWLFRDGLTEARR